MSGKIRREVRETTDDMHELIYTVTWWLIDALQLETPLTWIVDRLARWLDAAGADE